MASKPIPSQIKPLNQNIIKPNPLYKYNPSDFGYTNELGEVWLKDPNRKIGEWKTENLDDALKFYSNKFIDLVTEFDILKTRILSGISISQSVDSVKKLLSGLENAPVIGDTKTLESELTKLIKDADQIKASKQIEKEKQKEDTLLAKQQIIKEAVEISETSTDWKTAGEKFTSLIEQWKSLKGLDRKTDNDLWAQFRDARDAFSKRRGTHFAQLDKNRTGIKQEKEAIISEASKINDFYTDSKDIDEKQWFQGIKDFQNLLIKWKKISRTDRNTEEKLWTKFKSITDSFYEKKRQFDEVLNKEKNENAEKIFILIGEYEKQSNSASLDEQKQHWLTLNKNIDSITSVSFDKTHPVSKKLRDLEKHLREQENKEWKENDSETAARAQQFVERAQQFKTQALKARESGQEAKAKELELKANQWEEWAKQAKDSIS